MKLDNWTSLSILVRFIVEGYPFNHEICPHAGLTHLHEINQTVIISNRNIRREELRENKIGDQQK